MTSSSAKPTLMRLITVTSGRLPKLSSYDFYTAWKKYDTDGSGFIDKKELCDFLKEYLLTIGGMSNTDALTTKGLQELASTFLQAHDQNNDGQISIEELSTLLPTDQAFLLLFRERNPFCSAKTFMQAWHRYDGDKSGSIDARELKAFLKEIYAREATDDKKLNEYTKSLLDIFDTNKDGLLNLAELAQLLPPQENFLHTAFQKAGLENLTPKEEEAIFNKYDKDNSGFISPTEIRDLCADVLRSSKPDLSPNSQGAIDVLAEAISIGCDTNHDGKYGRKEIMSILQAVTKS